MTSRPRYHPIRLTALAISLAILIKLRIHEIVTGPLWWSFG